MLKKVLFYLDDFFGGDTAYYAASLSFFTIFSLLPILALYIGVITYFDVTAKYVDLLLSYLFNIINPSSSQQIIDLIHNFLQNSHKLGLIGIGYTLFVFLMFFRDYEYIISKMHHAKKRPFFKSSLFYLAIFLIFTLLFIAFMVILNYIDNNILSLVWTFLFTWLIFFLLFKYSSTKYLTKSTILLSSFITLLVLFFTKFLFVYYILYNKTYNTIYGAFSVGMFFFLWIYISWAIYLYGIKLCARLNFKKSH